MMWHTFFWPAIVVIPAAMVVVVTAFRRAGGRSGPMGPGCGFGSSHPAGEKRAERPAQEDPLAIVRERYARGEIDHAELERRVEGLLRSEPTEPARPWKR